MTCSSEPEVTPSSSRESNVHPIASERARVRLHERLGANAIWSTFVGWDSVSSEVVLVKRLHDHFLASEAHEPLVRAFVDDARRAMSVEHPHLVSTFAVVERKDEAAVTTRHVDGLSLAQLTPITSSPLRPAVAAALVAGSLRGLHAAHVAGHLHRDVSPSTILLGSDGVVRLAGLGMARAKLHPLTNPGFVKQRLAYASPEELADRTVDARSDVFAAAVVLWEALTGRALFLRSSIHATLSGILDAHAPAVVAPSTVNPAVSRALDAVVLRGLARDPAVRYPTAEAMAKDLERRTAVATRRELADEISAVAVSAERTPRRATIAHAVFVRETRSA